MSKPIRLALFNIDKQYAHKLNGEDFQYGRSNWSRWEGDKLRLLWSYFRGLCSRSTHSRSKVIDTLKTRYFQSFKDCEGEKADGDEDEKVDDTADDDEDEKSDGSEQDDSDESGESKERSVCSLDNASSSLEE